MPILLLRAGGPGAPRPGYSLPLTSQALSKCPCTLVLTFSCLAGNTRDPSLLSTNARQSPAGTLGTWQIFPKSLGGTRPEMELVCPSRTHSSLVEVLTCNVTALLGRESTVWPDSCKTTCE